MAAAEAPPGPDLRRDGVRLADVPDGGMLVGHFDGDGVVLVRKGGAVHAVGAKCSHYGGPLGEGLFDGELVRCPWHHACFRPETGEAVRAPAFDPVTTYVVELRGERVFVTGPRQATVEPAEIAVEPASVVILGGGAAGFAAAEMLRRQGYKGPVVLVSADDAPPYDRPNVSKDYLAGTAPEEWMPLRPPAWYQEHRIELLSGKRAVELTPADRRVTLDDGRRLEYGALLLATGATPVRLDVSGTNLPHVHTLRTMRDSRAIIENAGRARRAVVVGASFIGLEVAASLVARKLEVHVVAPEAVPMERVLGPEVGGFVRRLHEQHGVRFHMGQTVTGIREGSATLQDGSRIDADLVVLGVGVRPDLALAEQAGLKIDRGVLVDEQLRTSAEGIWAAGDIARWPDPHTGQSIRVEHWVVAERQGQTAALNILGRGERFTAVPFFWSQHYDVTISYSGHAERWDSVDIVGTLDGRGSVIAYRKEGKILAVASIHRDAVSLAAEVAMERGDHLALEELVRPKQGRSS